MNEEMEEEICRLHMRNYTHAEIQGFLAVNGTYLSIRQIKYRIKRMGRDRSHRHSDAVIRQAIREELLTWSRISGYRTLWRSLKAKGFLVSRERVRQLLREEDFEGVQRRQRRRFKRGLYHSLGPNEVWHIDGYDKLKPYGICISGCIDGYSRKLLWLRAGTTNNNPRVIATYFLDSIQEMEGCPMKIRADLGTENTLLAAMQMFFHRHEEAVESSVSFGQSIRNQRIEQFWSTLLRGWTEWWRQFLATFEYDRSYDYDKSLMQFCFMSVIQKELDQYKEDWNNHRVRRQVQLHVPTGIPNILFTFPERYGSEQLLQAVDTADIEYLRRYCDKSTMVQNKSLHILFNYILVHFDAEFPKNAFDGLTMYNFIKSIM